MKTSRLLVTIIAIAGAMTACSSSKNTVAKPNSDEVEVTQLCHSLTDEENFFANAIAESSDAQMAKDKAVASARSEIAANLQAAVENFSKRYRKDVNDQLDAKVEDRLQIIVKQNLRGSTITCDRITRTKTGKYRAYTTVRLSKKEIEAALERGLLEDKELKLNFDQAQFDKIADEEIGKAGL